MARLYRASQWAISVILSRRVESALIVTLVEFLTITHGTSLSSIMHVRVSCILVFMLLVGVHPVWTRREDDDRISNPSDQIAVLRHFRARYLSAKQRDIPEFSPEQRKFQQVALVTHNILRARHCAPPLELDDTINTRAQAYAEVLASTDSPLIHSTDRKGFFGENLYAVTRANPITIIDGRNQLSLSFEYQWNVFLSADKVTRTWYTEVALYDYKKPGYSMNIGHFSQIVWKNTKRLGIGHAFARGGRKMYVAAQYGPPGNYGFAFRENVLEPTCWRSHQKAAVSAVSPFVFITIEINWKHSTTRETYSTNANEWIPFTKILKLMMNELVFVIAVEATFHCGIGVRNTVDECNSWATGLLSQSLDSDFWVNLLISTGGDIAATNNSLVTAFYEWY